MSKLVLKVNKVSYSGFEEVNIFRSMLSMSGAFAVSVNNYFKGGSGIEDIKIDDAVSVEIEGQKILDGYINSMPIKYGSRYNILNITGKDKTANLISSFDFTPNEWKKQTVGNIIKNICSKYSINVVIDSSVTSSANIIVETFKANEGQFSSDIINELCRDYAIMPVSYGDGNLTLTKATVNRYSADGIITGINIDGAEAENSNEDRYSSYKVKGQGIGKDEKGLSDYIECHGEFSDNIVSNLKPLVIFSELPTTIGGCQKKAKWEARIRAGLSRSIEYQVPLWVQSNNKVWDINYLTKVKDEILGVDTTKLIMNVQYSFSEKTGEITKLTVVDKDTFNLSDSPILIKSGFDR